MTLKHNLVLNIKQFISELELDETHDLDNSMTLEEHITLNAVLEMEGKDNLNYHGSLDELYLTKLAVITMESIDTSTPYYNSMQKRDIADFISLEDAKADIYKIMPDKNTLQNMSAILNMMGEDDINKNRKNSKKKFIFVGRPKPYKIEDLNEMKYELNTQSKCLFEIKMYEYTDDKIYSIICCRCA